MTEIPKPHLSEEGDVLPDDYSEQAGDFPATNTDKLASQTYMLLALSAIRHYKGPPDELRWWWKEDEDNRRNASVTEEQEQILIQAASARVQYLQTRQRRRKRRYKKRESS